MKVIFSMLAIVFITLLHGQNTTIDSLKKIYPQQSGSEKALTLSELCFQLAYNDSKQAIQYGQMSYEAALLTKNDTLIAQSLNDWAIPYLVEGNFDTVLIICQKAFDIRISLGDSVGAAKTLNKIANANYELGNFDKSLDNNLTALEIFENYELEVYTGRILGNIGVIYEKNGMYDKAIENYDKSMAIAETNNNANAFYIAMSSKASCLTKLGQYDQAETSMKEALDYYLEIESIDHIGGIYQNLGFNARLNKQTKKGKYYYQKALDMYEQNNSEVGMSLIHVNLGQLYLDEQKYDSAEVSLKKGIDLSLKSNSFYQLMHAYKGLMRLENLKGDFQKADEYFDLYESQMDSLYGVETANAIAEMQVKYETEKKTQDLAKERLKTKNAQLWLLIALISIGLLLVLVLYVRHRKKLTEEKLKLEAIQNVEKERGRIARDLHDNLGADLTLITSKIDIQAFQQNDPNYKEDLENISDISKSANAQLRDTIWSIHKSTLDLGELASKIEEYASRSFDAKNTSVIVNCSADYFVLPPSKALHLFRISQEFLNNSLKYAKATEISIQLKPNQITLKDNGIGFDPKSVKRGYGLNNISERTKEFGGKLVWNSVQSGTELIIDY